MTTEPRPTALELAEESAWFKSSYSTENGGGGCVSVTALPDRVAIRDSKHRNGSALVASGSAWSAFIDEVRSDQST
ncbi:DUF397 domain-containing protein [Streptomyces gamaensis]|uniref:DUF397 domain-containing protein n=1 Tax=Streptomyces gamaensis TaxID=1763542 RepID=A0ABW0YV86_9ACTN